MEPDLYRALRAQDLQRVRECLDEWGNKRRWIWWSRSGRTLTPLHVASKGSCPDILAEILGHPEIGRNINEPTDEASLTPLHVAAGSSTPSIVRLLLDAGADISSSSADRSTPFHIACSRGSPETCAELLRRGAILEARDAEERTPLLRAVSNGRADITRWLLSEGADTGAVDMFGNSALALGCRVPNLETARALLDGGASVASEDSEGKTCIHLAAVSGRVELVDMMLNALTQSGQRLRDGGGCILFDVVERNLLKVMEMMASRRGQELGINLNRRHPGSQGATALHAAVSRGHQPIVSELLLQGADPNIKNDKGLSALHVACTTPESLPIVKLLLKARADPNGKDNAACAPIYYAFLHGQDDVVHYLISRGASLFRMDYDQALRIACFYGMVQAVESLLWMEADPMTVSNNKRDRDAEFHVRVAQTVRDGVRALLAEALEEDENEDNKALSEEERAKLVTAAKAAAGACLFQETNQSDTDTSSCTSADTCVSVSTTMVAKQWSINSGTVSCDSGSRSTESSSVSTSEQNTSDYEAQSSRTGGDSDLVSSRESDEDDDAFVIPVLDSLDNELLGISTPPPVNRPASTERRWTQRGRESATTGTAVIGCRGGNGRKTKDSSSATGRGNAVSFGVVKDRARATLAGVIKWATSPRNSRSPKHSRGSETPPRSPTRGRSPIMGRGVILGA